MSPIKNPEQLSTPTSAFRERWNRGELHHITNFGSFLIDGAQMAQDRDTMKSLHLTYGPDAVIRSNALAANGQPDGLPYTEGVYVVDSKKWAELHPEQKQ